MARGINKWYGIGSLGKDPEIRYATDGKAVANFSLACSEVWKDKSTGEQKEKTEWIRIVLFGRLAEISKDYLKKGSKVYIEGKLQTRKWQDKDGQDRYTTEIVANEMQMLNKVEASESSGYEPQQSNFEPGSEPLPASNFDDDVPF